MQYIVWVDDSRYGELGARYDPYKHYVRLVARRRNCGQSIVASC